MTHISIFSQQGCREAVRPGDKYSNSEALRQIAPPAPPSQ